MIVLSVYYTDKPGGFCKRLYRLFRALEIAGHDVHYCALDLPPDEVRESIHFHKIPFWTPKRSGLLFWGTFLFWCPLYLGWTAREVKPTRYAVFGAFYSSMLTIARIVHPAPLVLFLRSLVFEIDKITGKPGWVRALSGLVERFGIRTADTVVSMTKSMEDAARAFAGRIARSVVLGNDLPAVTGERADLRELLALECPNIALTAGVLDQRKNVGELLSAWRAASGARKDSWALVVAGKGPLEEELKVLVRGDASIHFAGWIRNLDRYLSSVQLALHPSLHEGVSNSVLEALASGTAVLMSDIPEHRELFPDPALRCGAGEWSARLSRIFEQGDELLSIRTAGENAATALRFDWDIRAVAAVTGH